MITFTYTIVDAFTSIPFQGNPAAVIILSPDHAYPDSLLQKVAGEFNLSETAFVTGPYPSGANSEDELSVHFGLRWFTPAMEIRLCGHATLASAKVLFATPNMIASHIREIKFSTLSGELSARRVVGNNVELEFPAGMMKRADDDLIGRVTTLVHSALCSSPVIKDVFVGVEKAYEGYALVNVENDFDLETAQVDVSFFVRAFSSFLAL